jgi:hypothetical protein
MSQFAWQHLDGLILAVKTTKRGTLMAWKESDKIYTYDLHSGPTVVFAGDTTSGGPPNYTPDMWHTIDLKPLGVSADASFAEINGFLIITDLGSEIDNLTATFRAPGSTLDAGNYQMQAISVFSGDGARQVQSVTVALVDGCFQLFWKKQVGGVAENGHPTGFLLNLWLAKWGRDLPDAEDQTAAITALDARIAALEAAPAPVDRSAAITTLQADVAALQAAVQALQPEQPGQVINVPSGGIVIQFVQED